jgi:AbiU2
MIESEKAIEIFGHFREHCIRLKRDYNTYSDLFNDSTREVLSKTAPTFFTDIADILQRDWILQACKLSDPPESKRKDGIHYNITVQLLNQSLERMGLLSTGISNTGRSIVEYGEKLKPARDKYIAHFDYEHQIQGIPLGETSEPELLKFIDDIQQYCDLVGEALGVGPLDFSSSGCAGDALDLLMHLKRACLHA